MRSAKKCLTVELDRRQIVVTNPAGDVRSVYTHRYQTKGMELLARLSGGQAIEDNGSLESQIRWIEKVALQAINHGEKTNFSLQPRWIRGRRLPEIVLVGG